MAVPGRALPPNAPTGLASTELFAVDAYLRQFEALGRAGRRRAAASRSADGVLPRRRRSAARPRQPALVRRRSGRDPRRQGRRTHLALDRGRRPTPGPGGTGGGRLDWARRHLTMRTHTALHILCGVIWADHGVAVTGGNMDPGKGRLDFPLPSMSTEFGRQVERRINNEIAAAHEIVVDFVGREVADEDPALIRTAAHLIPREIDPLRVIDIVGLDKQADGGTHVLSTAEVGRVAVTGTESKGKGNKRIRLEVQDPPSYRVVRR